MSERGAEAVSAPRADDRPVRAKKASARARESQATERLLQLACVPCTLPKSTKTYRCDQPGCNFRAEQKCTLTTHKRCIHGIDLVWYHCTQPGCTYRAKQKGNLQLHEQSAHHMNVTWFFCQ